MLLKQNPFYESKKEKNSPVVVAHLFKDNSFLHVRFQVSEPENCYASFIRQDGDHAWEDSCVEIFVQALDNPNEYINFEFTSKAFCYAARGRDRFHRKEFLRNRYSRILRSATAPVFQNGTVSWEIHVSIPAQLLGAENLAGEEIFGNLYKCADRARTPHYLTLFPISTERPDFHQPRFFQKLL